MNTVSLKLKNSDQCVQVDQHVYDWLKSDPKMASLKVLDYLYLHNTPRITFQRSIKISQKHYESHKFYLHNLIARKFLAHTKTGVHDSVGTVNGNFLDCRLENLVFQHRGTAKRKSSSVNNKTGYKGVHPCGDRYKAVIYIDRKYKHLGYFPTARQAAICYNNHAIQLFGEQCFLNTITDDDPEQVKLDISHFVLKERRMMLRLLGLAM